MNLHYFNTLRISNCNKILKKNSKFLFYVKPRVRLNLKLKFKTGSIPRIHKNHTKIISHSNKYIFCTIIIPLEKILNFNSG